MKSPHHFIIKPYNERRYDNVRKYGDVDFIIVNYQDNEACPESALDFILKAKEKAKEKAWM